MYRRASYSGSGEGPSMPRPDFERRHRPVTKCDRCRLRKQRCDSVRPCAACVANNVECVYTIGMPRSVAPDLIPAVSRDVAPIRQGFERIDALLQREVDRLQAERRYGPLDAVSSDSPQVDLSRDDVAASIARLWSDQRGPPIDTITSPLVAKIRRSLPTTGLRQPVLPAASAVTAAAGDPHTLANLLPGEEQMQDILDLYFRHCNGLLELFDRPSLSYHIRLRLDSLRASLARGLMPSSDDWQYAALAFAIARAAFNFAGRDEYRLYSFVAGCHLRDMPDALGDLATCALETSGFVRAPSLDGSEALIVLLSNMFLESVVSAPYMVDRWQRLAQEAAFSLRLNREPSRNLPQREADRRRRLWMSFLFITTHCCMLDSAPHKLLPLEVADVAMPELPRDARNGPAARLNLQSPTGRFLLTTLSTKVIRTLTKQNPLPTAAEVDRIDQELDQLEAQCRQLPILCLHVNFFRLLLNRPLHFAFNSRNAAHRSLVLSSARTMLSIIDRIEPTACHLRMASHAGLTLILDQHYFPRDNEATSRRSEIQGLVTRLMDAPGHSLRRTAETLRTAIAVCRVIV